MTLHDLDFVWAGMSSLGAAVIFGTRGLLEGPRSLHPWKIGAVRLVAAVAMIGAGAIVSHLFGHTGSFTTLVKTAVALWLAPFVLGVALQLRSSPGD